MAEATPRRADAARRHPVAQRQPAAAERQDPASQRQPAAAQRQAPAAQRNSRSPKSRPAPLRVLIIGGGVAGLATAALLASDGHRVTLLERNPELGGRAGLVERDGIRFDTGPSWYLMPECFDHFYRLLGTSASDQLDLVTLDPAYRVYGEGHAEPLDVRSGRERVMGLFERIEPGAGRRIARYLDSAKRTYDLAVGSFLYTTFERVSVRTFARILPRALTLARLLLESLEHLAHRTVHDTRLRQILGYPAVFLASRPDRTPSMYHLMSSMDLDDAVRYPMGGFTTIVDSIARLAREAGAELRTGVEVTGIRTSSEPVTGRARRVLSRLRRRTPARVTGVETAQGPIDADLVVSAADLHHTETRLLPKHLQTYPARYWRRRESGPGVVLALLGVEGELPELAHHTLVFTSDWRRNFDEVFTGTPRVPDPASIYVCRASATDPGVAGAGREALFVLIPVSPDGPDGESLGAGGFDGAGSPEVEAAVDAAVAQLSDWCGMPDLAERITTRQSIGPADFARDYHAWRGNALGPAHTLRQSAFLRGSNRSKRVAELLYAGATTLPGVGLPMCLISAENVLKRVRGDRSDGPLPVDDGGTVG